jgi:hypothetical protein
MSEDVRPRCIWPDCLALGQQQRLAEDIARTDRGEAPVIEPDQRLVCGCVDLGVDDGLGAEFEAHAEESLALANATFDAVAEAQPESEGADV